MLHSKRISAPVLLALKEALSNIYWYKDDLRKFLTVCLSDSFIIGLLNWDSPKRDVAWDVVDRLNKNEQANQSTLLHMMLEVSNMTDFSHLARLDGGEQKEKKARQAVKALQQQIKGLDELLRDKTEIVARRQQYELEQKKIGGVHHALEELKKDYFDLVTSTKPQQRGFQFEKILRTLFDIYDLDPKASFKIVGEQIDGAFTFDNTDYLLEAKWQKDPVGIQDLDALQGKVSRKLENTLGVYTSINGYSDDGLSAFMHQRPHLFLLDGADLMAVLDQRIDLKLLLKRKRREASQSGNIYLKVSEILNDG